MVDAGIPFTLKAAAETSVEPGHAVVVGYKVTGHARVDGARLVLEWAGTRQVNEVGQGLLRQVAQRIPGGRTTIPVAQVVRLALRSRWWRPRIELLAADPTAFAAVPGAAGGRIELYLSRHDVAAADEWVTTVRLEMAEQALRAAEAPDQLPPYPPG